MTVNVESVSHTRSCLTGYYAFARNATMIADLQLPQRITRLTPLTDVLAHIDTHVAAIAPRASDVTASIGRILAENVIVKSALPARAIALRDGWAISV